MIRLVGHRNTTGMFLLIQSGLLSRSDAETLLMKFRNHYKECRYYETIPPIEDFYNINHVECLEFELKDDDFFGYQLRSSVPTFDFNMMIDVDYDSPLWNVCSEVRVSLLQFSAFYGSIKCFKFTLLNECVLHEKVCRYSISGGNFEIIHILEHGGMKFTGCFRTAVQYNRNECCDWLLQYFICDDVRLDECLIYYNVEAFFFFLTNGADINEKNESGCTPLHSISFQGHLPTVEYLCEHGSNVNEKNQAGLTPLHIASREGHLPVVEYIYEHGSNLREKSENGWTPLHFASHNNHI